MGSSMTKLGDSAKALWEIACTTKVRVAEDGEVAEVCGTPNASNVREPLAQVRGPDTFLGRLGANSTTRLPFRT